MKVSMKRTYRVTTTQYEYEIVEAGVELDTDAGDEVSFETASDVLNKIIDGIAFPELERIYEITDAAQNSFVIDYKEGFINASD